MSMEQHPIPQNISSYEFRLVGDMTLKQFLQLAGGIAVGVVFYQLPLPGFVRYPLVFISVVIGIALAFVPINGRPFARYILAFIAAIYTPTQYAWRQVENKIVSPTPTAPIPPVTPINPTVPITPQTILPETPHPVAKEAPIVISQDNSAPAPVAKNTTSSSISPTPTKNESPQNPVFQPETIKPTPPPVELSTDSQTIFSSTPKAPENTPTSPPTPANIFTATKPAPLPESNKASYTNLIQTPTQPNILTGLVVTKDSNPVDSAIIEILDSNTGVPARALRTNRTGQFQIATPLSKGRYTIQTEKDGLTFAPINVEVDNKIIEPLIITTI